MRLVLTIIVASVLFSCSKDNKGPNNYENQDGIKGKPSTVYIKDYKAISDGESLKKSELHETRFTEYNKRGYKTFNEVKDKDGNVLRKEEWSYDNDKVVFFSEYAQFHSGFTYYFPYKRYNPPFTTYEYYYNSYGDIIRLVIFDKEGIQMEDCENTFVYDDKGNKIKETYRGTKGEVYEENTFNYEYKSDNICIVSKYNQHGILVEKDKHTYDLLGNLIEKLNVEDGIQEQIVTKYKYDIKNRLVFENHMVDEEEIYKYQFEYNSFGKLLKKSIQYELLGWSNENYYDDDNHIVERRNYSLNGLNYPDSKKLSSTDTYKYLQYDDEKNWIVSEGYLQSIQELIISEREIEYY